MSRLLKPSAFGTLEMVVVLTAAWQAQGAGVVSPYTVVFVRQIQAPTGRTSSATTTVRLDSDGTEFDVTQLVGPDGSTRLHRAIVSRPDGTVVEIDWLRRIVSTTYDTGASWRHRVRNPASRCLRFVDGNPAPGTLIGLEKIGDRNTAHIGTAERSTWYSTDLQCAPVKQTGPAGVQVAVQVSQRAQGDDLAALAIGFREVQPSTFYGLATGSSEARAKDGYYATHRPR